MNCKIVPTSEYENGCVVHGRSQLECQAAEIEELKAQVLAGIKNSIAFRCQQKAEIGEHIRQCEGVVDHEGLCKVTVPVKVYFNTGEGDGKPGPYVNGSMIWRPVKAVEKKA